MDVLQQNQQLFRDSAGNPTHVITEMNIPTGGVQTSGRFSVSPHFLKQRPTGTMGAYKDFVAFCVEISASIGTSATNPVVFDMMNPLDATRTLLLATLFENAYDPLGGKKYQAAFQATVWKLAHGDVSVGGDAFDLSAVSTLQGSSLFIDYIEDANGQAFTRGLGQILPSEFALAQGWLDLLDGSGMDWALASASVGKLMFLSSDDSQDLVTWDPNRDFAPPPVPLPASILMFGAAIGILPVLRRRSGKA